MASSPGPGGAPVLRHDAAVAERLIARPRRRTRAQIPGRPVDEGAGLGDQPFQNGGRRVDGVDEVEALAGPEGSDRVVVVGRLAIHAGQRRPYVVARRVAMPPLDDRVAQRPSVVALRPRRPPQDVEGRGAHGVVGAGRGQEPASSAVRDRLGRGIEPCAEGDA